MIKTVYTEQSSRIRSMEYESESEELIINYRRGGSYKYMGVPRETWVTLTLAKSFGKVINEEIKGKFDYIKLS